MVVIATSPTETGAIVAGAVAQGLDATMITTNPGWDAALLDGPDADAVAAHLLLARPWRAFTQATAGHGAMRDALGDVAPDDAYTAGWITSYPLRDALQAAADAGDLTRQGLRTAVASLGPVDHEGMLPPNESAFGADDAADQALIRTVFQAPDPASPTGTREVDDFFNGTTAGTHPFDRPCFAEP